MKDVTFIHTHSHWRSRDKKYCVVSGSARDEEKKEASLCECQNLLHEQTKLRVYHVWEHRKTKNSKLRHQIAAAEARDTKGSLAIFFNVFNHLQTRSVTIDGNVRSAK
jgi:hypothetical protein